MNKWDLRRRDLLRALGVGLGCLPLLQATRSSAQATTPKRLIIIASTEGYRQEFWRPKDGLLATQTLPDSSSPLEPHKDDVIFLPGMTHPTFTGGGHGAFPNHLATSNSGQAEYRVPFSATFDQVVGSALAQSNDLPMATLTLGILSDQGIMGEGTNSRYCFYKGKNQAVVPEQDPWKTYGQVFAGTNPASGADPKVEQLMQQKRSILDFVGSDLERFASRVGTDDKAIIDGHLTALRELEKQLQGAKVDAALCGGATLTPLDAKQYMNYPDVLQVSFDLMVAALKCDVTRVAGFQMVDAGGANLPWDFLPGIPHLGLGFHTNLRNWHDLGHNPVMNGVDHKRMVDKWCMTQLADLITKMKAIPEAGGTMLSNSVILLTNHMEDGQNHNSQKMPWVLAGQGGGYFTTGQCAPSSGKPIYGVLADVANALGVPMESWGDAAHGKPWDGLRA